MSITYEELYFQFDGTTLTSRNGMGRLLQEKLRQREEVNALIMTEDCIEMSYHLEYCPNCQRGGLAGAMNLLSLMDIYVSIPAFGMRAGQRRAVPVPAS